jgi:hypothetical protein
MLTDIFAYRYAKVPMFRALTEERRRLLVQCFQILSKDVCPYYKYSGDEDEQGKAFWTQLHGLLARELGVQELSPIAWGYWGDWQGRKHWYSGTNTTLKVCETWMLKDFDGKEVADRFIKERLSLVELGFRMRGNVIAKENAEFPARLEAVERNFQTTPRTPMRLPGHPADSLRAQNGYMNDRFDSAVNELNARFRQAESNLNYHNGFIQGSTDATVTSEIEKPFWALVADAKWKNVDHDMKEAVDLRDTAGRDPALYASRALESTIKIISGEKEWNTGNERGAANYIDNLIRNKFVAVWEMEALKAFSLRCETRLAMGRARGRCPLLATIKPIGR